jgi:ABC-2 type transport system permease protein
VSAYRSALRAELYRLPRNRTALFWGFLFIPFAYLLFTLSLDLVMVRAASRLGAGANPLWHAARSLGVGGNPLAHLFFATGAAAILGGEYRFATWRLTAPRLPRSALLLAKWSAYLLAACASLAILFLGSLIESAAVAAVAGGAYRPPFVTMEGLAMSFTGTFAEMAVLGSVVAAASVLTRSTTGAILIGFLVSLAQAMLTALLPPPSAFSALLFMPAFAGDAARRYGLLAEGVVPVSLGTASLSIAILVGWSLCGLLLALVAFCRQDLSRE